MKKVSLLFLVFLCVNTFVQSQTPNVTFNSGLEKGKQYTIILGSTSGNLNVDWGDGNIVTLNNLNATIGTSIGTKSLGPSATVKLYGNDLTFLKTAGLSSASVTAIQLNSCPSMHTLVLTDNQIPSIDVSGISNLATFWIDGNKLTSLDVSKNLLLKNINCSRNQLATLELKSHQWIVSVFCADMPTLTSLDISGCVRLNKLDCYGNSQLTSLNIDKNRYLNNVTIYNNNFSPCALDDIYLALPFTTSYKMLKVLNEQNGQSDANVDKSNVFIAQKLGWTVQKIDASGITKTIASTTGGGCARYGTTPETIKHFIIYGQSLSTGYQSWPSLSTENVAGNYMIGDQVWSNYGNVRSYQFTPLVANVWEPDRNTVNSKNRNSANNAECAIIGAVNHIQQKTDIGKIVASSCGTGGRSIEALSKISTWGYYTNDFLSSINFASIVSGLNKQTISCPAIFWLQGEANYAGWDNSSGDKNAYKKALVKLKDDMQNDIVKQYSQNSKPLFYTYQTGAQYTRGTTVSIGMAQLEAANENGDIICVGPVYQMTDRGGHLDSNGYRWYGELMGKVYYKTQVLGEFFSPLQPKKISRDGNPKIIRIQYLVPKLPLVFDERTIPKQNNYGFEIFNDNVKQTISKITIENDCVVIECVNDLTGTVNIVYGGTSTQGNGNLRDSDDYASFYKYTDLDGKNADGSYIYERDASESTLRPSYEPKDQSGKVIYNQNYPLQNWSVAFYYQLPAGTATYDVPIAGLNTGAKNVELEPYSVSVSDSELIIRGNFDLNAAVSITDLSGRVLFSKNIKTAGTANSITIPMNQLNLPNGLYIARIDGSKKIGSVKFIK